jgi:4-hydroxybenzoate polyprenyltransferase/phosphoserine phosphatase
MDKIVPLCVDLDGTLIQSDLLLESVLALIKRNLLFLFLLPFWLLRGKAALKDEIARRVTLDATVLPYRENFVAWLRSEREQGRSIWLCTASNHRLASLVSEYIGCFEGVLASDATNNLSGQNKAKRLIEQFGEHGFDYCGNASADTPIWAKARFAVVIGGKQLFCAAEKVANVQRTFEVYRPTIKDLFRAIRVHQWTKNFLLFIPVVMAHKVRDSSLLLRAFLGFVGFGFMASAGYIVNDLFDLEADRRHPEKKNRPLASGAIPPGWGILLAVSCMVGGMAAGLLLPGKFQLVLALYFLATLIYTFYLKNKLIVDVVTLAGLYTLRIIAGAFAVDVPMTPWLLAFSMFIFLSLAFVKRFAELRNLRLTNGDRSVGRGYLTEDLEMIGSLGSASGYLSVLVLALYINGREVVILYSRPYVLWFICPIILYWVSRMWVYASRGVIHEDPIMFVFKDKVSYLVGILAAVIIFMAL